MGNNATINKDKDRTREPNYLKVSQDYKKTIDNPYSDKSKEEGNIMEFFKGKFGKEIEYYFQKMYPKHHFLINVSVWSFLAKKSFPTFRLNLGKYSDILVKQEKGLSYLRESAKYYSTIDEFVANGIQSAFYFDRKEEQPGEMIIHEIDVDTREVPLKIEINGKHRANLHPVNRFSFTSLEEYKRARKGGIIGKHILSKKVKEQEVAYQNQVIRWYIRTGLFNPLDVKKYDTNVFRNLGNRTTNLLIEGQRKVDLEGQKMKIFQETLEAQFHSSIKDENRAEGYTKKQDDALNEVIDYLFEVFPYHIAARIYTFDTGFFDLSQDDNHISHIYWMPLLNGKKDQPTGGVQYINTNAPLHDKDKKDDLLYTASILTHLFSGQFDDSQMKEIDYINEKTTANSAGVSIMSRNISHNIGSHAISYEKNALMTWQSMLDNGVLEGLVKKEGENFYFIDKVIKKAKGEKYELDIEAIKGIKKFKFKYLEAVGFFLGYLQERIDYTSAVASGTNFYYGKVHLVDDILLHFLRENKSAKSKKDLNEWKSESKNRNILLERIVLSEDYHKEDIVIEYLNKDYLDVVVSLPTGVTGRQSIFAMLENIIRNTAKHGISKKERGGKIKILIDVEEYDEDYYKLSIIDNSGGALREDKLEEIQESITSSLMDGDGINERQKGIKEIQIAAAWLRGIEPRDIKEIQKGAKPILQVDAFPDQENVKGVKFQLFIKKAKEVLLVGNSKLKELNLPSSWRIVAYSDLASIVKGTQYNFVLFDKSSLENLLERAKKENIPLPIRHLEYDFSKIDFKKLKDISERIKIEEEIYTSWLDVMDKQIHEDNKTIKTKDLKIGIVDEQIKEKSEYPSLVVEVGTAENILTKYIKNTKKSIEIIYREHANLDKIKLRHKELYKGASFIESISGNNSTNRILREDRPTVYWARKIQESAACRVMIIDERIWKETIRPKKDGEGFYAKPEVEYDKMLKKQIYVYTIEPCSNEGVIQMEIINLKGEIEATLEQDGTINWVSGKIFKFHFISFHQGLLDKIYNYFTISDKMEKDIFFENMKTDNTLMYYLHSGRSFTPELPKGTGFIPLSSLDAAIRDCKLSLVDLLFSGALVNRKKI